MRKCIFAAITALVLFGCKESDSLKEIPETGAWASPYFITEYLVASEIAVENKNGTLCLKVSGEEYITHDKGYLSKEALYFINLYNDNSYPGGENYDFGAFTLDIAHNLKLFFVGKRF